MDTTKMHSDLSGFLLMLGWSSFKCVFKLERSTSIFPLSPIMAITLCVPSLVIQNILTSHRTRSTGVLVLNEFYIIQRSVIAPMSIAGIAKGVTTISVSAWFFFTRAYPTEYDRHRNSFGSQEETQTPLVANKRCLRIELPLSEDVLLVFVQDN
ncbi:hypothetical protein BDP27DRAFT_527196 [Rhodocollybia butyracea]|uniref:Uncharacterized protein n=1 Tax=Rhodocollybia butyracea TaxID=206335 RepID=A0A9P5Q0I2_9AGAR|nr:hypothetical protein BDP27DRAFT_527196 [Rhodocollybia butyracea]